MRSGDIVYLARAIPLCNIYEVLELKVTTITDNYIIGTDVETRTSFPFSKNDINKRVFISYDEAKNAIQTLRKEKTK